MICNELEYQEAVRRVAEIAALLAEQDARLQGTPLDSDELRRALDPLRAIHQQLAEEVASYERLQRGDLGEITVRMPHA